MKSLTPSKPVLALLISLTLLLAGCNFPQAGGTLSQDQMTQTAEALSTQVAATLEAEGGEPTEPPAATEPAATLEPDQPTPTLTPTVVHQIRPSQPGSVASFVSDRSSAALASENRTIGDNFDINLLERPFRADGMEYQPHLDITRAEWSTRSPWVYVSIHLEGAPPEGSDAHYGVEIDLDLDGRGDWLIWGPVPDGTDWSVSGVQALHDDNGDIGDARPMRAEKPPKSSDGYEQQVFDSGQGSDPDLAWVRRSPSNASHVQIAFKHSLIGLDEELLWNAWTDAGVQRAEAFDYHDHFSVDEAGSPVQNSSYYPLGALAEVDNTCRWAYGFEPTQNLPGMCPLPATPTPSPTATVTPTLEKPSHTISGIVYRDDNGNGQRDGGEPGVSGAQVSVRTLSCARTASQTTTTPSSGQFSFGGLSSGDHCVTLDSWPSGYFPTTPTEQSMNLTGDANVSFGIQVEG